jgi:hypothetical protein
MQVLKVRSKNQLHTEAIKWDKDSKDEVLQWLTINGVGFTFHEINSAGQLLIYPGNNTIQIPFGNWIIRSGSNNYGTCSQEAFESFFEVIDL